MGLASGRETYRVMTNKLELSAMREFKRGEIPEVFGMTEKELGPLSAAGGEVEWRHGEVKCQSCGHSIRYPVPYFGDDEAFKAECDKRSAGSRRLMDEVGWGRNAAISVLHAKDCPRQYVTRQSM